MQPGSYVVHNYRGAYEWAWCRLCRRHKRLTQKGLMFVHNRRGSTERCPMGGQVPGEWKYGRRGHNPRCDCTDCNATFREHNRERFCDCEDCRAHREIHAPAPPTTTYAEQRKAWEEAQEANRRAYDAQWRPTPGKTYTRVEAESVSTIHMCNRCDAIMKRTAMGAVSIMPNVETEQKNYELCPDCTREVWILLEGKPTTPRAKSYGEPFRPDEEADNDSEAGKLADEAAMGRALLKLLQNAGVTPQAIEGSVHDGRTVSEGDAD